MEQWKKERSGQFNGVAKQLCDEALLAIRTYITGRLQDAYGTEGWWREGVPTKVQIKCSEKRIKSGGVESDENFLEVLDYQKIVRENPDLCLDAFTPPGMEKAKREKRLEWFTPLNQVNNKVQNPPARCRHRSGS